MQVFSTPVRSLAWAAFLVILPFPDGGEALARAEDQARSKRPANAQTVERPPLDAAGLERLRLDVLSQSLTETTGDSAARPARARVLELLPGEYSDAGDDVTALALAEIEVQRREIRILKARLVELERLVEDCTSRMRQGG